MLKKTFIALCATLSICLWTFCAHAGNAALTLMVYMTGSDLESKGGAASADLQEMMQYIPEGDRMRVVVMASGSTSWASSVSADETSVYEVRRNALTKVQTNPLCSMGEASVLSDFLNWSYHHYPADRYALILWNHGGGPLLGVCFDELHPSGGSMDSLSMAELSTALQSSPFAHEKLQLIGFDACLMATAEVVHTVEPYAHYMVASQETEPASGWHYSFLQNLTGTESGEEISRRIIDAYRDSLADSLKAVTLSCMDLSRADAFFNELAAFCAELTPVRIAENYTGYSQCRSYTKVLGSSTTSAYDLVDLLDLLQLFELEGVAESDELMAAFNDLVIIQFADNVEYVNGLSVFYPFDNKSSYVSSWASLYSRMDFVPEYQEFVRHFSDICVGEALWNWESSYQTTLQSDAGRAHLSVSLTEDELTRLARSRLLVFSQLSGGQHQLVYYDDQKLRTHATELSASYSGEALYITDSNGRILAGPVSYFPIDNGVSLYAILHFDIDWSKPLDGQQLMAPARLTYHYDTEGQLQLVEVMTPDDATGLFLPSSIDISSCLEVEFLSFGPADGSLISLDFQVYYPGDTVSVSSLPWSPVFMQLQDRNERFAYLRMTDLQGNTFFSEIVPVPNPTYISLANTQTLAESGSFTLTLSDASLVTGYDAGLKFTFSFTNHSSTPTEALIQEVLLNGQPLNRYHWLHERTAPGDTSELVLFLSREQLSDSVLPDEPPILMLSFALPGETEACHVTLPLTVDLSLMTP
ncbi:MAG: hypothetical protein IKK75_06320 [Clostridia bacterium]|nr:hypothetical protein [Clostridia bacterium]